MLTSALSLAIATTAAATIVFNKLPRKIRRFLVKHSLFTDFLALISTYLLLGSTLTALMAAALVGLLTSALLHIANNPDDYLYLYDFKDFINTYFSKIKQSLLDHGKKYREKKIESAKYA